MLRPTLRLAIKLLTAASGGQAPDLNRLFLSGQLPGTAMAELRMQASAAAGNHQHNWLSTWHLTCRLAEMLHLAILNCLAIAPVNLQTKAWCI